MIPFGCCFGGCAHLLFTATFFCCFSHIVSQSGRRGRRCASKATGQALSSISASEGVIISHLGVTGAKTVILKAEKRRQKPVGGCHRGCGERNKEGLDRGRALKPCPGNRTRALAGHLVRSLSPSPFNIISQWRAMFFLLNEQTVPTSVGSEGLEANTFINQFPVFAHINPNKPPPTLIFSTSFFLSLTLVPRSKNITFNYHSVWEFKLCLPL